MRSAICWKDVLMMKRVLPLLFLSLVGMAFADEGMWLFNHPPTEQIKAKYHFTLTQPWLDHTRLSSVRFNNGGSGSFVSADGLTFTNHHVAQTCLFGLSTKERDLYKTGFYAKTQAEEAKCPDLELNQLVGIEDVTSRVNEGVTAAMSPAETLVKQRANTADIEQACTKSSGLRCDVVTLYAGGMYHLYKYKKYTDVRLVFAPEFGAAFFGGDPDNFEFPRYDLDITFFRVYENDKPAHLDNYFKWSTNGTKDGELVFVSGHPGSTGRLQTMSQLEFLRDVSYPASLSYYARRIKLLKDYASQSAENARQTQELVFSLENSQKAVKGYLSGLLDKSIMEKKAAEEQKLETSVAADPKKKQQFGDPWASIAKAENTYREIYWPYIVLERRSGGQLASIAKALVRGAAERQQPNPKRLPEFRESALPSLEQQLFSAEPVYKQMDTLLLADWLTEMKSRLPENSAVQKALGNKDPQALAQQIISGTKLEDVAVRKQLWEGGEQAIANSNDPLIVLFRNIDPDARNIRKRFEDEVGSVERQNGATLAKIRFALYGQTMPPDATFTLRLSYGEVKGYVEDGLGSVAPKGATIAPYTEFGGAFEHAAKHGNKAPYDLPASWMNAKNRIKLSTPLDFASTPDIIGGNSGSPVVNKAGEVVGIIFDGNIQSLPGNFFYDAKMNRAISVDSRGILEALRSIYSATRVADELAGTKATATGMPETRKKNGKTAPARQKATAKQ
jgi:hypothetical protein